MFRGGIIGMIGMPLAILSRNWCPRRLEYADVRSWPSVAVVAVVVVVVWRGFPHTKDNVSCCSFQGMKQSCLAQMPDDDT